MTQNTAGHGLMVSMRGVNKYFDDFHALQDINLDVPRGQVVVVLGPSGSGKSTLCRTINRLETIDGGEIFIDGHNLPEEGKQLAKLRSEVQPFPPQDDPRERHAGADQREKDG